MDWPDSPLVSPDQPLPKRPDRQAALNMSQPLSESVSQGNTDALTNWLIKREGRSPAGVINNPGNIKFVGSPGQKDSGVKAWDGGSYASYDTPEAGREAIGGLITRAAEGKIGAYGGNPTVQKFVDIYGNTGGESGRITAAGRWRVSDQTIAQAQKSPAAQSVYWADPQETLDSLPPMDDEKEPAGARQKQELEASLSRGDDITDLPTFDVKVKDGHAKIIDYDGRHRLQEAIDNGVERVPVVFKGLPENTKPTDIEGFRGGVRPFTLRPVDKVKAETAQERALRSLREPMLREADSGQSVAHQQAAAQKSPEDKVYYNELGQPFTLRQGGVEPGAPAPAGGPPSPPAAPPTPGEIPYVGRLSEQIAGIVQGAVEGGKMITGAEPVTRTLPPEVTGAAAALGGAGMAPGSRMIPGAPQLTAEGQNMLAGAEQARAMQFPRPVPPEVLTRERAALAKEASDRFGIPVYGKGDPAHHAQMQRALNREVAKTIGQNAEVVSSKEFAAAKKQIGGTLNLIEKNNSFKFDNDVLHNVSKTMGEAKQVLSDDEYNRLLKQIENLYRHMDARGVVSGDAYAAMMKTGAPLERLTDSADANLAYYGQQLQMNLRDGFERNLSPGDLQLYRNARLQYKNLKTIEPIVSKSPTGDISGSLLNNRVSANFDNRAADVQGTALDRLGKIGKEFVGNIKTPAPEGSLVRYVAPGAGFAAGHALFGPLGWPVGFAAGRALHLMAHHAVNAMARPSITERLVGRALSQVQPVDAKRAAINAMMSARGANTMRAPGSNMGPAAPLSMSPGTPGSSTIAIGPRPGGMGSMAGNAIGAAVPAWLAGQSGSQGNGTR